MADFVKQFYFMWKRIHGLRHLLWSLQLVNSSCHKQYGRLLIVEVYSIDLIFDLNNKIAVTPK